MNDWRKSSYSFSNGNCAEVGAWRKASASAGQGECAEVGQGGTVVLVRDTTDRGGPVLAFDAAAWAAFLTMVRSA
ncbi:MAG TPA: DUF397 domain-containing protein [Streptosporangiaceae bacterium]|nr:DUF397 domain-containing protein [Streptosporangiaceae bacterium]